MKKQTLSLFALLLSLTLLSACKSSVTDQPSWKFVIAGDSRGSDNGVNTEILSEIVQEIIAQDAQFILFPGDLISGTSEDDLVESQLLNWRKTTQPLYDAGIGVYPVRGNHETLSPNPLAIWNKTFSGEYALPNNGPTNETGVTYSVTHQNVLILALDQYINHRQVNQTWLDEQLKANTQPIIIALGHEPAFKANHQDCLDDQPAKRDAFWQSLQNAGCQHYACGHDHFFDVAHIGDGDGDPSNDVSQYVVGTAGAPIYGNPFEYDGNNSSYTIHRQHHADAHGYLLAEVHGDQLELTWYERDPATGNYAPAWESTNR